MKAQDLFVAAPRRIWADLYS